MGYKRMDLWTDLQTDGPTYKKECVATSYYQLSLVAIQTTAVKNDKLVCFSKSSYSNSSNNTKYLQVSQPLPVGSFVFLRTHNRRHRQAP